MGGKTGGGESLPKPENFQSGIGAIGQDNTVAFHRLRLQIPPSPLRAHFVKSRVKVRQYHNGTHAIFHGPRCLARYDSAGVLRQDIKMAA